MRQLEGPGHERRVARTKRAFARSSARWRRATFGWPSRKSRGAVGLLFLGAGLGASAFILLDTAERGDASDRAGLAVRGSYFSSCREAFQAGRANILRGESAYRAELDADGDGKACEPYVPVYP